jgi:hypothetical protein
MAHRALKAHTSTHTAHKALKAHTSTHTAHKALKAHTSTHTAHKALKAHTSTHTAHRALKAHTSTHRAHKALKAHTSTHRAHRALKAHTSTRSPTSNQARRIVREAGRSPVTAPSPSAWSRSVASCARPNHQCSAHALPAGSPHVVESYAAIEALRTLPLLF